MCLLRLIGLGLVLGLAACGETGTTDACALLPLGDAHKFIGPRASIIDGRPLAGGSAHCAWLEPDNHAIFNMVMQDDAGLDGAHPEDDIARQRKNLGSDNTVEDVPGIGTGAFIATPPKRQNMLTMKFAAGDRLISITTTVSRDNLLAAATAIAGRLRAR